MTVVRTVRVLAAIVVRVGVVQPAVHHRPLVDCEQLAEAEIGQLDVVARGDETVCRLEIPGTDGASRRRKTTISPNRPAHTQAGRVSKSDHEDTHLCMTARGFLEWR